MKNLLTAAMIAAAICAYAEELNCELAGQPGIAVRRKESGQAASPEKLNGKQMLRIDFNCMETPWTEFTVPLNKKFSGKKITVSCEVFLPENCKAKRLSIRLADSAGEVHQFSQFLPENVSGWTKVVFQIDTAKRNRDSWKRDSKAVRDGKLDLPVRFSGFAFNYKERIGTGWLGFGKLTITSKDNE